MNMYISELHTYVLNKNMDICVIKMCDVVCSCKKEKYNYAKLLNNSNRF